MKNAKIPYWDNLLIDPHSMICGECFRQFTIAEYKQLPKISIGIPGREEYTRRCPSCGYLFGENLWKKETPVRIEYSKRVFNLRVHTHFLEALYEGYNHETTIFSKDLITSEVRLPSRSRDEAIRTHDIVLLLLKCKYFQLIPCTSKGNITPNLVFTLTKALDSSPEKPHLQVFGVLSGRGYVYFAASTAEKAADKIENLCTTGRIRRITGLGTGPMPAYFNVKSEQGYFLVKAPPQFIKGESF